MRIFLAKHLHLIQSSIDNKLQRQLETQYTHLNKLDHLQDKNRKQTRPPHQNQEKQQFYSKI
jgi:hypothetical protein